MLFLVFKLCLTQRNVCASHTQRFPSNRSPCADISVGRIPIPGFGRLPSIGKRFTPAIPFNSLMYHFLSGIPALFSTFWFRYLVLDSQILPRISKLIFIFRRHTKRQQSIFNFQSLIINHYDALESKRLQQYKVSAKP